MIGEADEHVEEGDRLRLGKERIQVALQPYQEFLHVKQEAATGTVPVAPTNNTVSSNIS